MSILISHQSALELYRSPDMARRLLSTRNQGERETRRAPAKAPDGELAREILGELGISAPLHALVAERGARRASRDRTCHMWGDKLPPNSCAKLAPGVYVSTPEFLFLQLSAGTDFENRLMLGSELMGSYAIDAAAAGGLRACPPVTGPARPAAFLSNLHEVRGVKQGREAARWLIPGARSPKESEIAFLLSLPRRLGGRGIAGIELDRPVGMDESGRVVSMRSHLRYDLFIERLNLDIEYDSNDHHLDRASHEADERRRNALRALGVSLLVLTSGQLHDWQTFDAIATGLAREAGAPRRKPSRGVRAAQLRLWRRLLFARRVGGRSVLPPDPDGSPATCPGITLP